MEFSSIKYERFNCLDNTFVKMIYILDNFLPHNLFNALKEIKDFEEIKTPGKSFWISKLPEEFQNFVTNKISSIEGKEIKNILCFLREAKQNQDTDWRIHNDSIIQGEQPDRALVLFLSQDNYDGLNGTAFWKHKTYGDTYPGGSLDDFNKLLIKDSNDISKWDLKTVIGHKTNRLISYPCEYFHSKYPNEFKKSREVMVMFYKKINE